MPENIPNNTPNALFQGLPDISHMVVWVDYFVKHWGQYLKVWDVYNLEPAGMPHLLTLAGMNEHFAAYDAGSCLYLAPKEIFSHERTLDDALKAVFVFVEEIGKRDWFIQHAGDERLRGMLWVASQLHRDRTGKEIGCIDYPPSTQYMKIYSDLRKAQEQAPRLDQ